MKALFVNYKKLDIAQTSKNRKIGRLQRIYWKEYQEAIKWCLGGLYSQMQNCICDIMLKYAYKSV